MKKPVLKAKKAAAHPKAVRDAQTKRCDCCHASPCRCPETHDHKK